MVLRTLLVESEALPLDTFRGQLRDLEASGELQVAPNGVAALGLLPSNAFDVILLDLDHCEPGAWELLEAASTHQPQALRAAFSPRGDLEQMLGCVGLLHQVCPRPGSAEELRQLCARLNDPTRRHLRPDLRDLIGRMKHLPSVPRVFQELRALLEQDQATPKRVAKVLQQDMGMTARILGLVNSAFFGLPRTVHTVEEAVTFLGTETIKVLVLAHGIFDQTGLLGTQSISIDHVWSHSLSVSRGARALAAMEGLNAARKEEAFMGGLLHDVGLLVLARNLPDRFDHVLALARDQKVPIYEAELREFGTSHAEVGAHLLGLWGIQPSVIRAVALHHAPGLLRPAAFDPVLAIHVADHLCGSHQHWAFEGSRLDLRTLDSLGLRSHLEGWSQMLRDPSWK